ncbi:MAG: SCO family protein [Verrucomicrobiales bacterium]
MNNKNSAFSFLIWGLLGLVILGVVVYFIQTERNRAHLPVYGIVGDFTLTNQHQQPFSASSMLGKVWVADVIFTRCPGPCPKMTERMNELASAFKGNDKVGFVTITTDPLFDGSRVLKEYARRFGAEDKPWNFLTGEKQEVTRVAVESLKMVSLDKPLSEQENVNDLFIHTTQFVLVDKKGRIRGVYESLEPGFHAKMTQAINSLLKERI